MIVDVHAHIFPDKIAERASTSIADFYSIPSDCDGRVDTLLARGDEAGVDRFWVHSVATTPSHARSINDFIARTVKARPDRFVGLMALHPDMPDLIEEIDRASALGLRGVKLHPDIQGFALTEKRVYALFEAVEGRLPLLIHMGDYRYHFSNPALLKQVLDDFPHLMVVGAHMGGWSEWDEAERALAGGRLIVDCSSTMFKVPPERMVALIRRFGAQNVLFGSDFPMWNPVNELKRFLDLPLTDEERRLILGENAIRLMDTNFKEVAG